MAGLASPLRSPLRSPVYDPLVGKWGGAAAALALQVVGTRGEINQLTTTTGVRHVSRTRHHIGGRDATSISFADANWYVSATEEVDGAASFDLQRGVEYNGVMVPVTWSGLDVVTVAPGETVISDEIPASAFGVDVITASDEIWLKAERTRAATSLVVHVTSAYPTSIAGETTMYRADGAASQVHVIGALSTTGGWTDTFGAIQYLPLAVLGVPADPMMALFVAGASKEYGQSDSTGDGNNDGGGYVRRACADVDGLRVPYFGGMVSGESAEEYIAGSAKRRAMLAYCNTVLCGHGGNDYSLGNTIGESITNISTEWGLLKATGADVHMVLEMPKTDSTDTWDTVENQTPRTGYATGGAWRDVFNAHIADSEGTLIDGVVDLNATVADAVALDKWGADYTTDGTHPSKARQIALATPMASYLATVRSAYEGGTYTPIDYLAEADTYFAAITGEQPSTAQKQRINTFIAALQTAGVWTLLDAVWLFAAHSSSAGLINLKNPGTFNAGLFSAPTFTIYEGFTTNGTSNYLTGPNPATMGGNFVRDSACFGGRLLGGIATGSYRMGWNDGTDGTLINPHHADGAGFGFQINQAGISSDSTATTTGDVLALANRSGASATQFYTNGASRTVVTNPNSTSTALNSAGYRFGSGSTGAFTAINIASAYMGGSLTAQQHADLYAADLAYMQAVGAV